MFWWTLLIFGITSYLIGFFYSNNINKKILSIFSIVFLKEQFDRIFIILATLITLISFLYFWRDKNQLANAIQLGIFLATFFTLFYSVVIRNGPSNYRDRPKIKVIFDPNEAENYHLTKMQSNWLTYSQEVLKFFVSTYYIRLRVENSGKSPLKNTQVVLRRVKKGNLIRRFFPLNLTWSFAQEVIDIPPRGGSKTIDVFEIMEPNTVDHIYKEYQFKDSGPDSERLKALITGFRSCSIHPNSLSDIFEKGRYVFEIIITADNAESKKIELSISYDGNWEEQDNIKLMQKHLKVTVKELA